MTSVTKKKLVFITGTRADFGKIKPLLYKLQDSNLYDLFIFATGMHLSPKYGETVDEIIKCGFANVHQFDNGVDIAPADLMLANTLTGFSSYIKSVKPDMVIVHGDRIEPLAAALSGSLNNILVAHIEGGEVSGTIDEHLRHAISKLSHLHFVANNEAKKRLIQIGEEEKSIFVIGSPDLDIMKSPDLPSLKETKEHYDMTFEKYGVVIFHPVVTEIDNIRKQADILVDALTASGLNYVVIYPNNDLGNDIILNVYESKLKDNDRFRIFTSMRFEHFLTLIKNSLFLIGNSSAGIRETPFYGIPSINIGSRQNRRINEKINTSVFHCDFDKKAILGLIKRFSKKKIRYKTNTHFGTGDSIDKFMEIIKRKDLWNTGIQKRFIDLDLDINF